MLYISVHNIFIFCRPVVFLFIYNRTHTSNLKFEGKNPLGRYGMTQKKRELLKNPTKIEEIQEKKIIDRN